MSNTTSKTGADTRARSLGREIAHIIPPLLMLGALPLLWYAITRLMALLYYPYPHDGLEGTLLHEARLLQAGQPLYQPLQRFWFVSAPYPPVHPLVLSLADHIPGPHLFWGGRLVSLVATLSIVLLIIVVCRRVGATWLGAALGATIFISAPSVLLWGTRIKPDMLALLCTALGLAFATGYMARSEAYARRPLLWLLPALCFALAFFTKQTAVAAPLATGLALMIDDVRGWRSAHNAGFAWRLPLRWRTLSFGLGYAIFVFGAWALLDVITQGQFTAHVWGLHRSEWWTVQLLLKFVGLLQPYLPGILLAAAVVVLALRDRRALVPACYALVVPISLLGSGETGANHNHLLESLLAISLVVGIVAGWLPNWLARGQWVPSFMVVALLAAQIGLAYRPPDWFVGELAPDEPPKRFIDYIQNTPGEILADDVSLLVAAGRPLRYDDPSTMGPAARSGVWDQSGLIEDIAAQRFSAILIQVNVERTLDDATGRWTTEVLMAVRQHYKLLYKDTIKIYVPREG